MLRSALPIGSEASVINTLVHGTTIPSPAPDLFQKLFRNFVSLNGQGIVTILDVSRIHIGQNIGQTDYGGRYSGRFFLGNDVF